MEIALVSLLFYVLNKRIQGLLFAFKNDKKRIKPEAFFLFLTLALAFGLPIFFNKK